MIRYIFLSLPAQCTYQEMQKSLKFSQDNIGVTNWIMKIPFVIYSSNLQQKHTFREKTVEVQNVCIVNNRMEEWKYFVITQSNGKHYYCTTQIYYEKTPLRCMNCYPQFYIPKALVMISQQPYFKLQINILKIHRQLRKKNPMISYQINQQFYKLYQKLQYQDNDDIWNRIKLQPHHTNRYITVPIQIVFNFYIACCNNHIYGQSLYIQEQSNRMVLHLYRLQLYSLYQICYFLNLPISQRNCIRIMSAIMLQQQIIFTSYNTNLNVMVICSFMEIIKPLKWQFMLVPDLPLHLIAVAQQSFMPFIIGLHKDHLHLISDTNKIIVDLENDKVICKHNYPLIPDEYQSYFKYTWNPNTHYVQWEKQVKIKILILLSTLFAILINTMNRNNNHNINNIQNEQLCEFLQHFIQDTMMYQQLLQFDPKSNQGMGSQMLQLINKNLTARQLYLAQKMEYTHNLIKYASKFDNQKNWIRYYHNLNKQNNKFCKAKDTRIYPTKCRYKKSQQIQKLSEKSSQNQNHLFSIHKNKNKSLDSQSIFSISTVQI